MMLFVGALAKGTTKAVLGGGMTRALMQSPCRNRSGRAVTALAENKALRGKNPRQISGCLLFLPGIFHVFFRVPALHIVIK